MFTTSISHTFVMSDELLAHDLNATMVAMLDIPIEDCQLIMVVCLKIQFGRISKTFPNEKILFEENNCSKNHITDSYLSSPCSIKTEFMYK